MSLSAYIKRVMGQDNEKEKNMIDSINDRQEWQDQWMKCCLSQEKFRGMDQPENIRQEWLIRAKDLVLNPKYRSWVDVRWNDESAMFYSCAIGDVEWVQFLLSKELAKHGLETSDAGWNQGGYVAAYYGHESVIDFLCSKELDEQRKAQRVKVGEDWLVAACAGGQVNMIKNLLGKKDLDSIHNMALQRKAGWKKACEEGKVEVLKFLWESWLIKLKDPVKVIEEGVEAGCWSEKWDGVKWLIYRMGEQGWRFDETQCGAARQNENVEQWIRVMEEKNILNEALKKEHGSENVSLKDFKKQRKRL